MFFFLHYSEYKVDLLLNNDQVRSNYWTLTMVCFLLMSQLSIVIQIINLDILSPVITGELICWPSHYGHPLTSICGILGMTMQTKCHCVG